MSRFNAHGNKWRFLAFILLLCADLVFNEQMQYIRIARIIICLYSFRDNQGFKAVANPFLSRMSTASLFVCNIL